MLKTFLLTLSIFIISSTAYAGGTNVAYIPQGCEVESAEYSTGGGDKIVQYLEVLCSFEDGTKAVYIDRILSGGALIGLGRITQPDKIVFRTHSKDELVVK